MITVKGQFNEAKIFAKSVEEEAIKQIKELCDQDFVKDSKIRIMPDVHTGIGCVIGTTMTIRDKIVPNLVGVDIGCGVEICKLQEKNMNFDKLDKIIRKEIPSGFNIRKIPHSYVEKTDILNLKCVDFIDINRAILSIGTLGGGNHFIELDKDNESHLYLLVHCGSRFLGKEVAEYYQNLAYSILTGQSTLKIKKKKIKTNQTSIPKHLAYLEGEHFHNYLHDMKIIQQYAVLNRKAIIDEIVKNMNLTITERFTTIHNYIDMEHMILRKGAVSAQKGEKLIIPINMKDGSLICIGKGNPDWNYSAPHGAGRLLSRRQAKKILNVDEFTKVMKDIYTTSVNNKTLDEAPMVYKPLEEIEEIIKDTVEIVTRIKTVYNFKAG
ncbi:RtcB family protein [Petrotoga sp. 9PWA.NaAc.5.4]|uniref:RtcB family protein n=1 Tax=Petrotoga sp. 9PWA.NaAc.5.4 TaxID=1434328 RepID=UPI000CB89B34|nr:RtcB family protein [Petrotoga sp. 9PWA.NaAc.5.4]PNR95951.1 RtcB protein [Petrotoga sp. 9PWA.NaAc.5.4]